MPKISTKGLTIPASPIRKLTPFADQAKSQGKKIYHLNIGQPDIETPEIMLNAIKNIDFKIWAYTPSEGLASYRNKLSSYYSKLHYSIKPEDILITTGGSEAITITLQTCLDRADEVIIPEPFYANYNSFAKMADCVIKPIPSSIENGFALPDISEFERLITAKTKAIFICNPNNPTGYLYSREELMALKEICLKHDLFLISDEAYREFCYEGQEFVSPMHLEGLEQHAIVVDTVSKRYSACGARIGCILTKNKDVYQAGLKFAQARLSPPLVAQLAAEAAIDTPEAYFMSVKEEYRQRRDLLVKGLNAIPDVYCPIPGGAFYVMARLPVDDADDFCQWMLEVFDYEGATVMMAPGSGFYSNKDSGKDKVRLAYVINQEDIKSALLCLEKGLLAYQNRKS